MSFDFLIAGGGITGLSAAREIIKRHPNSKIIVLEKESHSGAHSSGRNSGVMHSGIYYREGSLKAEFCAAGRKLMTEYCLERKLTVNKIGKVIIPTRQEDDHLVDLLCQRAAVNGAEARVIDAEELKLIEPCVQSASGRALYSPQTSVIDPVSVLKCLAKELTSKGVEIKYSERITGINSEEKQVKTEKACYNFGHFINCAGAYADKLARYFGIADNYTMLPFKGLYYKLSPESGIKINGLIYPVPDLNVPFLGVHSVKSADGTDYFGPTAIPAFGRENYKGMKGIRLSETAETAWHVLQQYFRNQQGFRSYAHAEAFRFLKAKFAKAASELIPDIRKEHLLTSEKVGIRGQLLDKKKHLLVMDFLVENAADSTHVLNIVSPGFTSAFSFSKYIIDNVEEGAAH